MAKPKGNPQQSGSPLPEVPPSAIRVGKIGGLIAGFAAAAMSAQTLVALGHLLGYHGRIAWLLPASLDVYAATSIWVSYSIPTAHPASAVARRDARLALVLTVGCNMLYHLLLLAGNALPKLAVDALLVAVAALSPLVVERILHLQHAVRNGGERTPATVAAPATPPVAVPPQRVAAPVAPVAEPAVTPLQPRPTATPAATPVATRTVAANAPARSVATGRNAAVATLVPRPERLRIVREMVAERGPKIPLAEITGLFGGDKSTASRLLAEAVGGAAAPAKAM